MRRLEVDGPARLTKGSDRNVLNQLQDSTNRSSALNIMTPRIRSIESDAKGVSPCLLMPTRVTQAENLAMRKKLQRHLESINLPESLRVVRSKRIRDHMTR